MTGVTRSCAGRPVAFVDWPDAFIGGEPVQITCIPLTPRWSLARGLTDTCRSPLADGDGARNGWVRRPLRLSSRGVGPDGG